MYKYINKLVSVLWKVMKGRGVFSTAAGVSSMLVVGLGGLAVRGRLLVSGEGRQVVLSGRL